MGRVAAVSAWILGGRRGRCPYPAVLDDMEGPSLELVVGDDDRRTVGVLRASRVLWIVTHRDGGDHVRYNGWPHMTPLLLEFLRAHWDAFVDAGYSPSAWFLSDCPDCGAGTFEPCRNKGRRGAYNRRPHRGRQ